MIALYEAIDALHVITPDMLNGLFEFVGACLIGLSINRLRVDREVKGVSLFPVTFFASWGFWNLFFYPYLHQWWSFAGGLVMVTMNGIWMLQMAYFIWVEPPVKVQTYTSPKACPHGHEDWDECPVCCH